MCMSFLPSGTLTIIPCLTIPFRLWQSKAKSPCVDISSNCSCSDNTVLGGPLCNALLHGSGISHEASPQPPTPTPPGETLLTYYPTASCHSAPHSGTDVTLIEAPNAFRTELYKKVWKGKKKIKRKELISPLKIKTLLESQQRSDHFDLYFQY